MSEWRTESLKLDDHVYDLNYDGDEVQIVDEEGRVLWWMEQDDYEDALALHTDPNRATVLGMARDIARHPPICNIFDTKERDAVLELARRIDEVEDYYG